MKKYLITVKKIQITEMYVTENTAKKAIAKVADLMNKCVEKEVDLNKTFDKKPFFKYKSVLVKDEKKSSV